MKKPSSSSVLELTPQPKMKKINRSAFFIVCGLIAIIIFILAYSVSQPSRVEIQKSNDLLATSSAKKTDERPWYATASNSLPLKKINNKNNPQDDSSRNDNVGDDDMDEQFIKKQETVLQAAFNSSIKAPDIENRASMTSGEENNRLIKMQNGFHFSAEKQEFLQKIIQQTDPDYLHETVKKPISPYEVKAGTLIPAVLSGGINSDLPGQLTALVSQNVYDSVSGNFLLIPQGSKLILQYDAHVSYGQQRLLVLVKRLIFPNGNSLDLEDMSGVDTGGYAGFSDQVDNHYLKIFGGSAMMGLITGGFQLSQSQKGNDKNNSSISEVMASAMGQQMGQVAMGMMDKNLSVQPTLMIRPGYEFNVEVTKDLVFPGTY